MHHFRRLVLELVCVATTYLQVVKLEARFEINITIVILLQIYVIEIYLLRFYNRELFMSIRTIQMLYKK